MHSYLRHLLFDIAEATANASFPFMGQEREIVDWISDEEEERTAPIKNLEEWTGIQQDMLPPAELLDDQQVATVLEALKKMLDAYNCSFVLQIEVQQRLQYECIRQNFSQDVKVKTWHAGFFKMCELGTEHKKCALKEYCECAFYEELFSKITDEELTQEEERARMLQIEIQHLKRKYEDDWMKYYPYRLDSKYDDKEGNPYNYGYDDFDNDDDAWWRQ